MTKMRDSMPVVFAILAGIFLLMIIFQWGGQGTLFSPKGEAGTLGTVNGYPITQKDYNKIYEGVIAQKKSKDKDKESILSEKDEADAADNAWDQAVSKAITDQSIQKMGIIVTSDEIRDMLFNNPPADIKQRFTDSTGVYHQDEYIKALRDPRNDSTVRLMEGEAKEQILQLKWQQAMAGTVRVTDTEAFIKDMTDSAKAILQIIKLSAPQITPSMAAQISSQEIQTYYDSHSWLFNQPEQRGFKFVRFPLIPNGRDTALVMETANTLKARLAEAPLATIDTVAKNLAQDYSDLPFDPRHVVTMTEMGDDTSLISSKVGDAVIATVSGKFMALRVLQIFDTIGEFQYRVRHISINYPPDVPQPTQAIKDSILGIANQIMQQLKSGGNFAELARTRSGDAHSVKKGGDMGWVHLGNLPPQLVPSIASATVGDLLGPIEAPRGYEILQVTRKSRSAWLIIGVPLQVKPSHQTLDLESQMANIFREQAQKNGFDQAATSSGLHAITDAPAASRKGSPIFNSHLFVDWIFSSSKGDVSQPTRLLSTGAIVVAQLTDILPAGPKPLPLVKSQITQDLALRKAVATLLPRAQQIEGILGPNGDLATVAASVGDPTLTPVTVLMGPAESVNGLPTAEYVVNNWAYSAQPGTISPPLKGEHGYYIAKLMGRSIPSQNDFASAKPGIVKGLVQEKERRLLTDWVNIQKEHAVIEDFRSKR